jgi:hypothetical protein
MNSKMKYVVIVYMGLQGAYKCCAGDLIQKDISIMNEVYIKASLIWSFSPENEFYKHYETTPIDLGYLIHLCFRKSGIEAVPSIVLEHNSIEAKLYLEWCTKYLGIGLYFEEGYVVFEKGQIFESYVLENNLIVVKYAICNRFYSSIGIKTRIGSEKYNLTISCSDIKSMFRKELLYEKPEHDIFNVMVSVSRIKLGAFVDWLIIPYHIDDGRFAGDNKIDKYEYGGEIKCGIYIKYDNIKMLGIQIVPALYFFPIKEVGQGAGIGFNFVW